jgi:hypothetical protein
MLRSGLPRRLISKRARPKFMLAKMPRNEVAMEMARARSKFGVSSRDMVADAA